MYIYIYMCVWYVRPHFSSTGAQWRKMGGVYSQLLCCSQ